MCFLFGLLWQKKCQEKLLFIMVFQDTVKALLMHKCLWGKELNSKSNLDWNCFILERCWHMQLVDTTLWSRHSKNYFLVDENKIGVYQSQKKSLKSKAADHCTWCVSTQMVQCKKKLMFVPVKIVWSEILSTVLMRTVYSYLHNVPINFLIQNLRVMTVMIMVSAKTRWNGTIQIGSQQCNWNCTAG